MDSFFFSGENKSNASRCPSRVQSENKVTLARLLGGVTFLEGSTLPCCTCCSIWTPASLSLQQTDWRRARQGEEMLWQRGQRRHRNERWKKKTTRGNHQKLELSLKLDNRSVEVQKKTCLKLSSSSVHYWNKQGDFPKSSSTSFKPVILFASVFEVYFSAKGSSQKPAGLVLVLDFVLLIFLVQDCKSSFSWLAGHPGNPSIEGRCTSPLAEHEV